MINALEIYVFPQNQAYVKGINAPFELSTSHCIK